MINGKSSVGQVIAILLLSVVIPGFAYAQGSRLETTFNVGQPVYFRDEPVDFRFQACNVSGAPIEDVCRPCGHASAFAVVNSIGDAVAQYDPGGCTAECVPDRWEVDECRTEIVSWDQKGGWFHVPDDGARVPPGVYSAETRWSEPPLRTNEFDLVSQIVPIPSSGAGAQWVAGILVLILGLAFLRGRDAL